MTRDEIVAMAKSHLRVSVTDHDAYLALLFQDVVYPRVRLDVMALEKAYFQTAYTQNLVAGTAAYSVKNQADAAVDWLQIIAVHIKQDASSEEWTPVPPWPGQVDETQQVDVATSGGIGWYRMQGTQIILIDIPDEAVTNGLKIIAIPEYETVAASGTPAIPKSLHFIVADGLAAYLAERLGNEQQGDRFHARFNQSLAQAKLILRRRTTQPTTIEAPSFHDGL